MSDNNSKNETLLEIAYIIVRLCQGDDFGFDLYDLKELFDKSNFTSKDYESISRFVFDTETQKNDNLKNLIHSYKQASLLKS